MDDEIAENLTASLHVTVTNLSGVANGLAGVSTDDEIEQLAKVLDRIAEDASEGAAILRMLIVRRMRAHGLLPRRVPRDSSSAPQVPAGQESATS
jgi:hypothetical protein